MRNRNMDGKHKDRKVFYEGKCVQMRKMSQISLPPRYRPRVPSHLYRARFVRVVDSLEEEVQGTNRSGCMNKDQKF